jgi:hypothetical protein
MAERQALLDAILVRRMHRGRARQTAPALRILRLQQMPFACSRTQYFAAGRNLETFGSGLLCFNPFWASHNSIQFLQKERAIYECGMVEARGIFSLNA